MKLYDMDKREWEKFTRGDSWRSDAAYQCEICGTKTNCWTMGGYPCTGPRIICPADGTKTHAKIELFVVRLRDIEEKIKDYKEGNVVNMLREEKEIIEAEISKLRSKVDAHDITGEIRKIEKFWPACRVMR